MDGQGLDKRLEKAFKKAVFGMVLLGAIAGGTVGYFTAEHGQKTSAPHPAATAPAPAPTR
jgi:hypothetical protein